MSDRPADLAAACERLREALLAARGAADHWTGRLSASALSTATAVSALCVHGRAAHAERIRRGAAWLLARQNADGGWGDTVRSRSNLPTTSLALAALTLAGRESEPAVARGRGWLDAAGGFARIRTYYGEDRTFAAPILANLALAGLEDWAACPTLPFWLALLPQRTFGALGLPVVSYALPALIAVGLARFRCGPKPGWTRRRLLEAAAPYALDALARVTPESGGYLEAVPITAFVAMTLVAAGEKARRVTERTVGFLLDQQNEDGSWRIERDLAIWLTTLSVGALGGGDEAVRDWLLSNQSLRRHRYVGSAPGGWGWTNGSGSVPDADDTAGAVLALSLLPRTAGSERAARAGIGWLLGLQNRDGGWPTFCRGWRKLPFDQSCPDITAHAVRAVAAWGTAADPARARAVRRGFEYLAAAQRADGSWVPLWFGCEPAPGKQNPVYGTARVLPAYAEAGRGADPHARRGVEFLLAAQHADGGWGGAKGVEPSIEETGLACEALTSFEPAAVGDALVRGLRWLAARTADPRGLAAAPIGLYFAELWYYEELYPVIFAVSALRRALLSGYDRV